MKNLLPLAARLLLLATLGFLSLTCFRPDAVTLETIQAIAEALGMTVDIIDPGLQDLAPLKRLT